MFRMKIIFPFLLLFIARSALSSILNGLVILSSHSDEPTEGDTVELTCNLTSTSLPATNRLKLYYFWIVDRRLKFFPNSSGPAVDHYGHAHPRYSFKDDGRTFVIDSVRYNDKYFACAGSEDDITYLDDYYIFGNPFRYCLRIIHKPYIGLLYPPSKRVNAAINKTVSLIFQCEAYPPYSPKGSWTFDNFEGVSKDLPPDSDIKVYESDCLSVCLLRFKFDSTEYYGNYSFNMTNDLGSATVTFQVLPEAPPDAPPNVMITNVTHNSIDVEWDRMWSNSIEPQQAVFWQLTQVENGAIVESSNTSYEHDEAYNYTYRHRFDKNVQPETNYKVNVWSMNSLGRGHFVEIEVKTQNDPKLIPTAERNENLQNCFTDETDNVGFDDQINLIGSISMLLQ